MAFGLFSFLTQALTLRKYTQEILLDGPPTSPVGTRQIRENFEFFPPHFYKICGQHCFIKNKISSHTYQCIVSTAFEEKNI
jgi:hypothetical protein